MGVSHAGRGITVPCVARDDPAMTGSGPGRRCGADRWRALALPALLMLVATVGVARSVTLDQSSWQGASFGMFATYDNSTSRAIRTTVHGPDGARRVVLPDDLAAHAERVKVVPTDGAARGLAEEALRRVDAGGGSRVVVEVWRLVLDDDGGGLRAGAERLARGEAER